MVLGFTAGGSLVSIPSLTTSYAKIPGEYLRHGRKVGPGGNHGRAVLFKCIATRMVVAFSDKWPP